MNTLLRYNKVSREHLILNTLKLPTQTANKAQLDSINFNIQLNKGNKKNTEPSRHSQINKKNTPDKTTFTLKTGKTLKK